MVNGTLIFGGNKKLLFIPNFDIIGIRWLPSQSKNPLFNSMLEKSREKFREGWWRNPGQGCEKRERFAIQSRIMPNLSRTLNTPTMIHKTFFLFLGFSCDWNFYLAKNQYEQIIEKPQKRKSSQPNPFWLLLGNLDQILTVFSWHWPWWGAYLLYYWPL